MVFINLKLIWIFKTWIRFNKLKENEKGGERNDCMKTKEEGRQVKFSSSKVKLILFYL